MAKGNLFLGSARGSVGDVTFSVNKGQQVTKRRNREPNNPRTFAQMKQRARFAYLSKFFSKATQQFFKMAFEDRRSNESDYNAFMRHNLKNVPYATKVMVDNPNTPWFGHFLMTKGSLSPLDQFIKVTLAGNMEMVFQYASEDITLGQLSASIIEDTTLLPNDIITIAFIKGAPTSTPVETLEEAISNEALSFDNGIAPAWKMIQFRLNTSDTTPITELGFNVASAEGQYSPALNGNGSSVCGAVMVASRNTKGGLKVSDSHIITNGDLDEAIAVGLSADWADFCASSWQANEEAILQGALLAPVRVTPSEGNLVNATIPMLPSDADSITLSLSKPISNSVVPNEGDEIGHIVYRISQDSEWLTTPLLVKTVGSSIYAVAKHEESEEFEITLDRNVSAAVLLNGAPYEAKEVYLEKVLLTD